ncbi:MAG: uroporphyrinogen-III synthase [Alphaproteobacteria bacterium]|nr:uroporphyrinogen-III synthase [Alphaproteobacteria bacterium]
MATVLVTRPSEEAAALAAALTARGHGVLNAPLLEIRPRPGVRLDLGGVQALLATSANGVRALAAATERRDLALFAVGPATATVARAHGFLRVFTAGGDVGGLAALVRATLDPAAGALLHAAGSAQAGDLAGDLGAAGFTVRRAVLYDAVAVTVLPAAVPEWLAAGRIDAVLLFSPRSARTFVSLIGRAGIAAILSRVNALCLSSAVAAEARDLPWRRVLVADGPEQPALLDLLDRMPVE